jgi:hypothetical protein
MKKHQISRTRPLATRGPLRRWGIELYREFEKLSFRGSSERSRHPGIQEADDCLEDTIRSEGIAPMYPENPPAEAEHHRLVGMRDNSFDLPQTECLQAVRKTILE